MSPVRLKALAAIILLTTLVVPAHAESLDTAGKQLYAGIAVVSAATVVGVIFLVRHEHHKMRTITGCVASGPAGMSLEADGKIYPLSGDQKAIRPGEKMTLEGRREGNKFQTQSVIKDLGACKT